MISKLRKKLIILFLIFTMSAFSVVLTLMGIYTVSRVRNSQTQYVNNLADSLLEQLQAGSSLDELDLTYYAKQSKCFVYVTDGKSQMDSGALLGEKTAKLIEKIKEEANITSSQEYSSLNGIIETHIDSRFDYADRSWYGIRRIFSGNMQLEMVLICSGPNLVGILWRYCGWYPVIWLLLFTTMYFMSRFLIAKALDPVGKSIQSQKEFVASASHELKAPLSVIQVNAETIHTGDSVRKQETILEECSRMAGLIQSLLILETCDAGSWKLNIKEADVDTILIEEWYAFIETASKKKIRLEMDMEEHYPKLVCDKERISQTLSILIDNALSYSPAGTVIQLGARVEKKGIVFSVIDHGPGIPDSEKEKVFDRFYCGDPSRTDKNHYGLGLSIAQEIVKAHQGTIRLVDTLGGGATFEMEIPLQKAFH